jgi:hypothetical protein
MGCLLCKQIQPAKENANMLHDIVYFGTYRGDGISVDVMLGNPLEYGIDPDKLVFKVKVAPRNENTGTLRLDAFVFYVMDNDYHLYRATTIPYNSMLYYAVHPFEPVHAIPSLANYYKETGNTFLYISCEFRIASLILLFTSQIKVFSLPEA